MVHQGRGLLKGKVALVAGGAKNLGGLVSRMLASEGASVVVHYNSASSKKDAMETVQAIKNMGCECIDVQADFTKVQEVGRTFAEAKSKFGRIDVAVS